MNTTGLLWEQQEWQAEVHAWIRAELAQAGLQLAGSIEQPHIRPWSTVLQVPTEQGTVFFKATAPYLAHEAAVTAYLTRFRPALFPNLLAFDLERSWMLMSDAGTPLRQLVRAEKSFARWGEVMPQFVQLQKDLTGKARDLLALGMPDRRLERLPALFEALIADEASMLLDQPEGLTADDYGRLKQSLPEFGRSCELLASAGIPETLHHDDFHDGNIFVREGRILFTDWAESAIAHPFFSLVVLLRGAENSLEAYSGVEPGPDAPEIVELRRLYLGHWSSHASMHDLEALARIAERKLGYANRALTWHWVISKMPVELRADYAAAVPGYLKEYLNG
jgi:hypothetical protein